MRLRLIELSLVCVPFFPSPHRKKKAFTKEGKTPVFPSPSCQYGVWMYEKIYLLLNTYISSISFSTVPANSAVVTTVITYRSGHPIDQKTKTSVEIRWGLLHLQGQKM